MQYALHNAYHGTWVSTLHSVQTPESRAVMNNMDRRLPISTACHVATLLDPSVKAASELTRAEQVGR